MKFQKTSANFQEPLYFAGRWVQTAQGLYTTNLGAQMFTQISQAQQVQLTFSSAGDWSQTWLAYRLDEQPFVRVNLTQMPLTVTLPDFQTHTLQIVYAGNTPQTNVWRRHGGLYFEKITAPQSAQLEPIKPAGGVLTFIGDSITAGSWVVGREAGRDYRPEANFAALVAQHFDMVDIRIGYPGAGITQPGSGGVPTAMEFLTHIDADNAWQPLASDAVVINIGTTDKKTNELAFRAAFEKFLQKVTLLYPATPLLVLVPLSQQHAAVITEETQEYPQATLVETRDWQLTYTDSLHPDQAGSRLLAQQVIAALTPLLKTKN